jgi:hypothetical protein
MWQDLLRESLSILAMPAIEQCRLNSPGCITCELFEDFKNARMCAVGSGELTAVQRLSLDRIEADFRDMPPSDCECRVDEVLHRESWERIRMLATDSLATFGWKIADVRSIVEVSPGVLVRPPLDD